LGTRARVLKPIYGVLVYGVCIEKENIDPSNQAEVTEKIRTENATLYPGANIIYIGWLTKSGAKKPASSLVVEFTTCYYDCELYDRGYKLKQYYKCQKYGYIGTQYIANDTCRYCTEPHNMRQYKNREEPSFIPKCTLYKGPHTAWSNTCQVRKIQIAKVEDARRNRPMYYGSSETVVQPLKGPAITEPGPTSIEPRNGPIQSQIILIPSY
jgi:hypothetical protein